jgi:MFS family permease
MNVIKRMPSKSDEDVSLVDLLPNKDQSNLSDINIVSMEQRASADAPQLKQITSTSDFEDTTDASSTCTIDSNNSDAENSNANNNNIECNCNNDEQKDPDSFALNSSSEKTVSLGIKERSDQINFEKFRMQYLFAFAAIMLADGLQGTHLYVLYEGYGYSVASLYALGFSSGAITSVFTGAIVDRIGRKKAVMIYCALEIFINYLEQYPVFLFLVISRVIGGITTNLLFTVFETWLVTEHRKRHFEEEKLTIILRDSNIVSNLAAILSGYIAHLLASAYGPVGPFEGAVGFTVIALVIVTLLWCENYGDETHTDSTSMRDHFASALKIIKGNPELSRLGLIHGLTEGSLQTFVFLWSPILQAVSSRSIQSTLGLDKNGEPAYGLIFGAYMLFGVLGGFFEPKLRSGINKILKSIIYSSTRINGYCRENCESTNNEDTHIDEEKMAKLEVNYLCAGCYLLCSILFFVPCVVDFESPYAFSIFLASFLLYELLVGVFIPSQGVVRSIYIPNESMCSIMNMLRFMTNIVVAFGVLMTNHIPLRFSFFALSSMMIMACILQLSFIPRVKKDTCWKGAKTSHNSNNITIREKMCKVKGE